MPEKKKRKKKFKLMEIDGITAPLVSSWEEEQEAREQGFTQFHYLEKKRKKKRKSKSHYRYSAGGGIFQLK